MKNQVRSENPRFISSTISLGTFSVINMVLGLGSTILLTHHSSISVFGIYTLVLVIINFLYQSSTLGMEMSISRFIAGSKDEVDREKFLSIAMPMRLAAILLACLLAWIGRFYLMKLFNGSGIVETFFYIPLLFTLESTRGFFRSTLQGCMLFTKMGITDSIAAFSNFLLLVILIYILKINTIAGLILIRIFSALFACLFAFVSIPIKKRFSIDLDVCKRILKFGLPLQINDILQFVQSRIDTLVIAALLNPASIALYEVARKIPDHLRALYEPFRSVYYPFLTKQYEVGNREKASDLLNASLRFVAFIVLFSTAISILFSRDIISVLFSEKYSASAPIFIILMINLSIGLISNVMGTTLVAVGDSNKPLIINAFNAIVSLLGSILLIPGYQIIGAGLANTSGTAVAYPLNIYFLRKKITIKNWTYLKPMALLSVWGTLVWLIKPSSILVKVGYIIIFLIASFLLSIVKKQDFGLLLQGSGIFNLKPFQKVKSRLIKL